MDGLTLTEALHRRGVNMRYLGTLLMELERVEEKGRLSHVQVVTVVTHDRQVVFIFIGFPFESGFFSHRGFLSVRSSSEVRSVLSGLFSK